MADDPRWFRSLAPDITVPPGYGFGASIRRQTGWSPPKRRPDHPCRHCGGTGIEDDRPAPRIIGGDRFRDPSRDEK